MKTEGEYVDEDRITNRLLTDEEMWVESECNSDWDGEQIWEQISQAQDTKTLKAVGEWLEGIRLEPSVRFGSTDQDFYWLGKVYLKGIVQLKQGKMPE